MRRSKGKAPSQPDTLPCRVIWRNTPPTPAQEQAWRKLWTRLLGHVDPTPETPQPQDPVGPRAAKSATVGSGHNLLSEQFDDSTHHPLST